MTGSNAQMELEAARSQVMSAEKDVVLIKKALRALDLATVTASSASTPSNVTGETTSTTTDEAEEDGGDGDENSLKVYATKVTGLPSNFRPTIHLQLSSPIESHTLTSLYDPLDITKEGSFATFRGVETDVATLELRLEDGDRIETGTVDGEGLVGRSAVYPVSPMCDIDFLGGGVKRKSTELTIAIVSGEDAGGNSSLGGIAKEDEALLKTDGKDETMESDAVVVETKIETDDNDETTESETVAKEINTETAEKEESTTKSEAVVEETNTEIDEKEESTTKSEAAVDDDDVFEDAISKEESNVFEDAISKEDSNVFEDAISKEESTSGSTNEKELEQELELTDASKSEEEDAVVIPSASVVKEDEAKDDAIPPPVQETATISTTATSTTTSADEETTTTVTAAEEEEKTTSATSTTTTTTTTVSDDEEEKEQESSKLQPSTTTPTPTTTTTTSRSTSALIPTCTIDIRVEFNSSPSGVKDALYDLLNKASRKKAEAIGRLRKAAEEMNRSKPTSDTTSTAMVTKPETAVKKGFLNKTASTSTKKEPMVLVRWYRKYLGPESFARVAFPVAKNYLLFFGGLFVMHFQGHQLALPPPV